MFSEKSRKAKIQHLFYRTLTNYIMSNSTFSYASLTDPNKPQVMGILNVTPDSFYDGGQYTNDENIIAKVRQFVDEQVDIIDIGGMSSRPGAEIIPEKTELERVVSAIQLVRQLTTIPISIDTLRVKVAEKAILHGANMINDISGGQFDKDMFSFVATAKVPYCLMHMRATPQDMQAHTHYQNIVEDIYRYFVSNIEKLQKMGFEDVVIDLGFGFSKTLDQNYQLLSSLTQFSKLGKAMLVGVSRKSMIYKYLNISSKEALNGSTVLHTFALMHGANILRVHDVKEAVQAVKIFQKINDNH